MDNQAPLIFVSRGRRQGESLLMMQGGFPWEDGIVRIKNELDFVGAERYVRRRLSDRGRTAGGVGLASTATFDRLAGYDAE
jgi:hypothetical protein